MWRVDFIGYKRDSDRDKSDVNRFLAGVAILAGDGLLTPFTSALVG